MNGLVLTDRGKTLLALLALAAMLTFVVAAFLHGEAQRCTWLADNHSPTWIAERECPASYLP